MTNDVLTLESVNITVIPGFIEFDEFEALKEQALALAGEIEAVDVTEDNIKVSKKMLAAVNGKLKEMDTRRISIKKELMQPYESFEAKVKEIVNIVKAADETVRSQVRELEENERSAKRDLIQSIFDKRIKHYTFGESFGFDQFLKPNHLNKSTTMKTVETDMVKWLQKIDSDLKVISGLPKSDLILMEYYVTKDVTKALAIVSERQERKEQLAQSKVITNAKSFEYCITIADEKDFDLVELFMKQKNIKFESKKVGI